jgi:FkbM family methyltransferase
MSFGLGLKLDILSKMPAYLQRKVLYSRYKNEISISGEYELRILHKLLSPSDIAIDIGVNLGVYSYLLSTLCAHTTGFEPNARLAKMVSNLRIRNLTILNAAASSSIGVAQLLIPNSRSGHVLASLDSRLRSENSSLESVDVNTITVDSLNFQKLDFMKIDVEGFEEDVLKGAVDTVQRCKPYVLCEIEERHNPGGLTRINQNLSNMGYIGYFFRSGQLQQLRQFDADLDQNYQISHLQPYKNRNDIQYINNFLFVHNDSINRFKSIRW